MTAVGFTSRYSLTMRLFVLALTALACTGCSLRAYHSGSPENISITTRLDSGKAHLSIYSVDGQCASHYEGTVWLSGDKEIKAALPEERPVLLEFVFKTGSMISGTHTAYYSTYLTPRKGRYYLAEASYRNKMYGAELYERGTSSTTRLKLPSQRPPCVKP